MQRVFWAKMVRKAAYRRFLQLELFPDFPADLRQVYLRKALGQGEELEFFLELIFIQFEVLFLLLKEAKHLPLSEKSGFISNKRKAYIPWSTS